MKKKIIWNFFQIIIEILIYPSFHLIDVEKVQMKQAEDY
jgi:hypothetical protein